MNIKSIFVLFAIFFIKSSAISLNSFKNDNDFMNSLCQNLRRTIDLKNGPHDILLARTDDNMIDSVVDDLSSCLGTENAVVLTNLSKPLNNDGLRKAKLIIIEGTDVDFNMIVSTLRRNYDSTVWNYMANFLFISHSTISHHLASHILFHTSLAGYFNVALMHNVNGQFEVKYTETIMTEQDETRVKTTSDTKNVFFSDKIKNSKGYPIHIPVFNQPPFLLIKSGTVINQLTKFVEILEDKLNAVAIYHVVQDSSDIRDYSIQRKANLALNKLLYALKTPKMLTYEENGFCALVPKSSKTANTEFIFKQPFNRLVWMLLGCSVLASSVIWRLFLNRGTSDSFWLLLFGMFAMFVGQGVEFRRTHRVVLVILLQLIVFMIFVLSSAYQGIITSFMIQPEIENRIKTVKELLNSDMKLLVTDYFFDIVKDSVEFQVITSRMELLKLGLPTVHETILRAVDRKSALILQCSFINSFLDLYKAVKINYYLLPQKIITTYGQLAVGINNPFLQKFQHLMDLSFEAGLPQAWNLFSGMNYHESTELSHQLENLALKDLSQIFCFLIFAHAFAIFVYLAEKFFCDFIDKLDLSRYTSKLRSYINELTKLKKKEQTIRKKLKKVKKSKRQKAEKPKVRRIQVQPAESVV